MLTSFQKRKLITLFNQHDINCNGKLEASDFHEKTSLMASVLNWPSDSEPYQKLDQGFANFWQGLQAADTNNDGTISYEEWWAWWDQILSTNLYDQIAKPIGQMAFLLCNADDKGIISKENFLRYYEKQCCNNVEGEEVYQKLTSGSQHALTYNLLNQLLHDYFHSNDISAAGNWMFGKF